MASVRDLKKDIKMMVEHFVQECYAHLSYSPPMHVENILDIISDAVALRDTMLIKLTHTPEKWIRHSNREQNKGKSKIELKVRRCGSCKQKRDYYNAVAADFYDSIVELTERLNSLE
jgi:hypothetical protein